MTAAVAKDGELRHFDSDKAFLEMGIDEEVYV